ncbi:MAG: DNA adenine methylase, partial [Planctomycetota bacterium]|nr:DNA adenine methylase [Planctomycetota bacterium]
PGYFTETFCVRSRFFQPKNGERIDAIRERIAELALPPELEAVLLVSLMEAADRVDSTTGLQMAYLKEWAPRSYNDLVLRLPEVLPRARYGKGKAYMQDALEAAQHLQGDVAYIDPPYNQHSYLGNYHIWESLVRWDKPQVYGVACKRVDCRQRKSVFNSKSQFFDAFRTLLHAIQARALVISFNNEGYISRSEMESLLRSLWNGRGHFAVVENDYRRYVGAQIGIYNPQGEKVGKVSHLRNREYLYVASPEPLPENIGKGGNNETRWHIWRSRGSAARQPHSRVGLG